MSSIHNQYLKLKSKSENTMYLFKIGKFYIFLEDDAKRISMITTLKLIKHSKDVVKCGFPAEALEKYLDIFKNLNLDIELIENNNDNSDEINKFLEKIKKMNLEELTPRQSMNLLYDLKDLL